MWMDWHPPCPEMRLNTLSMISTVLFSQQDGPNGHVEQSSRIISAIGKQANLFIPLSHHFRAHLSQTLFFLRFTCMYVPCIWFCVCMLMRLEKSEESIGSSGARVINSCELPNYLAADQTQVLWKSSKFS